MNKNEWIEITVTDVLEAIRIFDADKPEYPEARSTFLIYKNQEYPAKHIRGMAYEVHYGREISKSEYTGGIETINFFKKLGFATKHVPTKR